MRVAIVIERYDGLGGGAERWTDRFARALIDRGVDTAIVAESIDSAPESIRPILTGDSSERRSISTRRRRIAFALTARAICRRERFDVVHDMGSGFGGDVFSPHHGTRSGVFRQNLAQVGPIARITRRLARRFASRYREFDELERIQYDRASRRNYVALSQMVADDMKAFHRVDERSIRVIPNGVDSIRFRPAESIDELARRDRLRGELRIGDGPAFLFAAHNFRLKGLDRLIVAFDRVRRVDPRASLVVLGGDDPAPYHTILRRLDRSNGRRSTLDAVVFAGNQVDPTPYYQSADAFIQPTWYDPCSLTTIEAAACGLPVVTTMFNGAAELFSSNAVRRTDSPDDVEGLIHAMVALLDSGERRLAGSTALVQARSATFDRNVDAYLDLYREVVAEKHEARSTGAIRDAA
jgi:UDP-glucose:(heptosyl)LPS alpha-1,3-glucosyltransferase